MYLEAVEGAFCSEIDYAMLVKVYEGDSGKSAPAEQRYSPAVCTGEREQRITGTEPVNENETVGSRIYCSVGASSRWRNTLDRTA